MPLVPEPAETIVALATPEGRSALAIIRVSGRDAIQIVDDLYRAQTIIEQKSRSLHYGWLQRADGTLLDEVVMSVFRAPRSYTREDVVEISCHGNPLVAGNIIDAIVEKGARLAEPGEFTLRAFKNGALDLAQAEAVAEVINAESPVGHQIALQQLRGGYSSELKQLRNKLINLASLFELELDFSEEDVEFADRKELVDTIKSVKSAVTGLIDSYRAGNVFKSGVPTVIVGKPNAGKSTLLNLLLNENRAIVSEIPGTTRDVIEERLNIEGYQYRLIDTAGLRASEDPVEQEGVRRTAEQARASSIAIYLFDLGAESYEEARQYLETLEFGPETEIICVANKMDAAPIAGLPADVIAIAALTGQNVQALTNRMVEIARKMRPDTTIVTSLRHLEALKSCQAALARVETGLEEGRGSELVAADMREALNALGLITGEVTTDDLLGNIFSQFCIGK